MQADRHFPTAGSPHVVGVPVRYGYDPSRERLPRLYWGTPLGVRVRGYYGPTQGEKEGKCCAIPT